MREHGDRRSVRRRVDFLSPSPVSGRHTTPDPVSMTGSLPLRWIRTLRPPRTGLRRDMHKPPGPMLTHGVILGRPAGCNPGAECGGHRLRPGLRRFQYRSFAGRRSIRRLAGGPRRGLRGRSAATGKIGLTSPFSAPVPPFRPRPFGIQCDRVTVTRAGPGDRIPKFGIHALLLGLRFFRQGIPAAASAARRLANQGGLACFV